MWCHRTSGCTRASPTSKCTHFPLLAWVVARAHPSGVPHCASGAPALRGAGALCAMALVAPPWDARVLAGDAPAEVARAFEAASVAPYRGRPARQQRASGPTRSANRDVEINLWHGGRIGDHARRGRNAPRIAVDTRVDVAVDSGDTLASEGSATASICTYFAGGCCSAGARCSFLHRLPLGADERRLGNGVDCFGRNRHATQRHDMGGVGCVLFPNRSLYVNYEGTFKVRDDAHSALPVFGLRGWCAACARGRRRQYPLASSALTRRARAHQAGGRTARPTPAEAVKAIALDNFKEFGPVAGIHVVPTKVRSLARARALENRSSERRHLIRARACASPDAAVARVDANSVSSSCATTGAAQPSSPWKRCLGAD